MFIYQWRGRPVWLRLGLAAGPSPPCPKLYDRVLALPVIVSGDVPPDRPVRDMPAVADWLEDLVDEERRVEETR